MDLITKTCKEIEFLKQLPNINNIKKEVKLSFETAIPKDATEFIKKHPKADGTKYLLELIKLKAKEEIAEALYQYTKNYAIEAGSIPLSLQNGLAISASIERWRGIREWKKAILFLPKKLYNSSISSFPNQQGAWFATKNTDFVILPSISLQDNILAVNIKDNKFNIEFFEAEEAHYILKGTINIENDIKAKLFNIDTLALAIQS